ncbi:MAG: hypothetical protein Satyrvirus36_12 [Satyrvirus sp.]|uniref:Uncharacterized protein n=1 Tax=Satyrvirus sp. TaxID=2487771 RepID=A0A3G5AGN1_9VIRU|nr:MAG: hypothetical protein Satyrvirus36_12 [Satyrvirus sp.]
MEAPHFMVNYMINRLESHGIKYENLCEFLKNNNGIVFGSFLIACLLNNELYNDIDIMINREGKTNKELLLSFNKIFDEKHCPGIDEYTRDPCCVQVKDYELTYHFILKTPTIKIDLLCCKNDPKDLVTKYIEFDVSRTYFDGTLLHTTIDVNEFVSDPKVTILEPHTYGFDIIYDPWALVTMFYGISNEEYAKLLSKGTLDNVLSIMANVNDISDFGGYVDFFRKPKYNRKLKYIISEEDKNKYFRTDGPDNYCKHTIRKRNFYCIQIIKMYQDLMKNYVGPLNINTTPYRIYKLLFRCLKFIRRGIRITNFNDFFKDTSN